MSAGFHRLGTNLPGKVTGYHHLSLPVGVIVAGMPVLPVADPPASATPKLEATLIAGETGAPAHLNRDFRAAPSQPSLRPAGPTALEAKASGYTGDECDNCHSMRMRIAGHCLVCEACGTTTGCS